MNYLKKGEDPPLEEDSKYPDWLWEIAEPPPTLFSLERKLKGVAVDEGNELEVSHSSAL